MGVFGPYYPPLLQLAVSHAERFAAMLAEIEVYEQPTEEMARAWLTGRTEEIEMVVGCVVEDWKAGRLPVEAAERAVSSYLRAMHAGAQRHLELDTVPECCLGDVASTIALGAADHEASTVALPQRARTEGDTLIDPAALLGEMVGKRER
jgi:hypothetical protein